jgi:alpha-glucuronidase
MVTRALISTLLLIIATLSFASDSHIGGDTGYRLWLKYDALPDDQIKQYQRSIRSWRVEGDSATDAVIRNELQIALPGLIGADAQEAKKTENRQLVVTSGSDAAERYGIDLTELGSEGYQIQSLKHEGKKITLVAANTEVGALYGSFALLRAIQTGQDISKISMSSSPKIKVRVLNHWDNLDRHVERGYAGQSIWDWHKLPEYEYQRYHDYARANASLGINGTVLNNVNADPLILTEQYLEKIESLANTFRPYGIKVYVSVKFSSPQLIGGMSTSDPLDPEVQKWWQEKAQEIYARIPDFGGFLVKANSEGQPGPHDFGRDHAQGANMLADALAPHGGIVMWRAFVYANEKNEERSKQAYSEFKPLDGKFRNNVLIQVKNGPIDFQPREPFSPLFGGTPSTPMMMEFQITMEYTGFSTHLVYLGPLYEEVLRTDTHAKGPGSTVAKVVDGSVFNNPISGMAGVANIGTDPNWTGHPILQSNWYVFGRMAWNHELTSAEIADEWIQMTLTRDQAVLAKLKSMMMASREITVNYMTPLGLHHIMAEGHHYGPGPWVKDLGRDDWTSVYYHRASKNGIGFDRSPSGVNAVEQYHEPIRSQYSSPETIPQEFLLWFHHLPWDHQLANGRKLWDEIVHRYYQGAEEADQMLEDWRALKDDIEPLTFKQVEMSLQIQAKEARWWRNSCVLYFQSFSNLPIPKGFEKPEGTLEEYIEMQFPHAPGRGG